MLHLLRGHPRGTGWRCHLVSPQVLKIIRGQIKAMVRKSAWALFAFFNEFVLRNNDQQPWQIKSYKAFWYAVFHDLRGTRPIYNAIAVLMACLQTQGYRKSHYSALIVVIKPGQLAWHAAELTAQPSITTQWRYWLACMLMAPYWLFAFCLLFSVRTM